MQLQGWKVTGKENNERVIAKNDEIIPNNHSYLTATIFLVDISLHEIAEVTHNSIFESSKVISLIKKLVIKERNIVLLKDIQSLN